MRNVFYFTADWCGPCKKVRPIVEEINRDSADIKFRIIDADQEGDLVRKFNISSVPTFIVLEDDEVVFRVSGAQTKENLESLLTDEF